MTSNRTMQRYLKTLGQLQQKAFKTGKIFVEVSTWQNATTGGKLVGIRCWATKFTPRGCTRMRCDIMNNETEECNTKELNRISQFINN